MNTTTATITMHTAGFSVVGETKLRLVQIAVVRRRRGGKTTRVHVVDSGAATVSTAWRVATRMLRGESLPVRQTTVDHGHLGEFAKTNEERSRLLAAIHGMNLGIGEVASDPDGNTWAGRSPLVVNDDAQVA